MTWGSSSSGGDSSTVSAQLSSGVVDVFTNSSSFAALKGDGSVVTWGSSTKGGDSSAVAGELSSGVVQVISGTSCYAAIKENGAVITWGKPGWGGDSSSVSSQLSSSVIKVVKSTFALSALKNNGVVVSWGWSNSGGDNSDVASLLQGDVIDVVGNGGGFAALKSDGSAVSWGQPYLEYGTVKGYISSGITSRKKYPNSPAWQYNLKNTERIHAELLDVVKSLDGYPSQGEYRALFELWDMFSSRGVSTFTDKMLAELIKIATPEQMLLLEEYAVSRGRVLDQSIQDTFAIRQVRRSSEYRRLMAKADLFGREDRSPLIKELVVRTQKIMGELGIAYVQFLENLNGEIHATQSENKLIEDSKVRSFLDEVKEADSSGVADSRRKVFSEILPYIKTWKPRQQKDFILYVRGSESATPFIQKQFSHHGPEKIRSIFQGLPTEVAIEVVSGFLEGTLLARGNIDSGQAKELLNYIIDNSTENKEALTYAHQMVQSLLVAIKMAKNSPLQLTVLSALSAMTPSDSKSIGKTLKVILEAFPAVGPKIAQGLVPTNIFDNNTNKILSGAQDRSLIPNFYELYQDAAKIRQSKTVSFIILDKAKAASMKVSYPIWEPATGLTLMNQVYRENIQNNSGLYVKILQYAVADLIKKDRVKWSFVGVIVDGAVNAVAQEKRFRGEPRRTLYAKCIS